MIHPKIHEFLSRSVQVAPTSSPGAAPSDFSGLVGGAWLGGQVGGLGAELSGKWGEILRKALHICGFFVRRSKLNLFFSVFLSVAYLDAGVQ